MTQRDGGKGDAPRPLGVPVETFEANWDKIFGKNKLADKLVKQIEENLRQNQYITPED